MRAGRPVGLPESAVMSSEVQNGIYKGSGGGFASLFQSISQFRPSRCAVQGHLRLLQPLTLSQSHCKSVF